MNQFDLVQMIETSKIYGSIDDEINHNLVDYNRSHSYE